MKKVVENTNNELPNGYKTVSELPEDFSVSGDKPTEDSWVKLKKGIVQTFSLKYKDYVVTMDNDKNVTSEKKDTVDPHATDAYQEVEYLESTGTQYIDTGVLGNNTIGYDLNVKINEYGSELGIFAVSSSSSGPHYVLQAHGDALKLYLTGNNGATNVATYQNDNNFHKVEYNKNNDYSIYFDKNNLGVSSITNTPEIPYSFNIFSRKYGNTSNRFSKVSIKYLKIYDSGVLVRDYIPVIRKIDNKPGMLDLANYSRNLFNKDEIIFTDNSFVKQDGTIVSNNDYYISDKIYLNVGQTYTWAFSSVDNHIAQHTAPTTGFYNSNDELIGVAMHSNSVIKYTFTVPENCSYIRQSVYKREKDYSFLYAGTETLPYEPYKKSFYTNAGSGDDFIAGPEI